MSNIEKIRQEIERQLEYFKGKEDDAWDDCDKYTDEDALWYQGHWKMCSKLLAFIDSLSEEKPSEDLNDEIKKFIEEYGYERGEDKLLIAIVARHFAEWQKEQDTREMIMSDGSYFQKCYELGKKDMREQMLKDAVEAKIYGYDDGSFELIASWLDIPNNSIYKDGDKVKIIIVKEE